MVTPAADPAPGRAHGDARGELRHDALGEWPVRQRQADYAPPYDEVLQVKQPAYLLLYRWMTKGRRVGLVRISDDVESAALAQLVGVLFAVSKQFAEDVIRRYPAFDS